MRTSLLLVCLSLCSLLCGITGARARVGPGNATQHTGYVTVRGTEADGAHLFYWFEGSRNPTAPEKDPLVVWLTGGPGCSSVLALLVENGPFRVDPKTLDLSLNPDSWTERANVLWIDQPVGTGTVVRLFFGCMCSFRAALLADFCEPLHSLLSSRKTMQDTHTRTRRNTTSRTRSRSQKIFGTSCRGSISYTRSTRRMISS